LSNILKAIKLNTIAVRIAVTIVFAIVGGIALEIALPVILAHFGSSTRVIISRSTVLIVASGRTAQMLSGEVVGIATLLAPLSGDERQRIIETIKDPRMRITLRPATRPPAQQPVESRLGLLAELTRFQLDNMSSDLSVSVRPSDSSELAGAETAGPTPETGALIEIGLPGAQWLSILLIDYQGERDYWLMILLRLSPLLIVIILMSIWTARRLAAPIREFARAAETLGVDMTAAPLAVRGPHELRTAIRAFNLMQERLRRFLADRTQMLAAISHDLRAPLARLRLRAEFVEEGEQQRKMFGDLEAMNAMIDTTLAFARDDARQEPRKLVDLGVLVSDICEDMADAGSNVCYVGPRAIEIICRPSAIRRVIANLIDNAVKYGRLVEVRIVRELGLIAVVIDDDGPGIPVEEQEKVFAPFYRIDPSRDPGKGGVGLGLSVARTIAREHGGDVTLRNRPCGGLSARAELPG
jgi:signal transduction histidine kinase